MAEFSAIAARAGSRKVRTDLARRFHCGRVGFVACVLLCLLVMELTCFICLVSRVSPCWFLEDYLGAARACSLCWLFLSCRLFPFRFWFWARATPLSVGFLMVTLSLVSGVAIILLVGKGFEKAWEFEGLWTLSRDSPIPTHL